MKKTYSLFIAALLIMSLSGCSGIKYMVDLDDSIDFTKYKTFQYYGWAEESNKLLNQLEQQRIETAFGAELNKRGLEYTEENGDLMVTLFIVTEQKTKTTATTTQTGGYGGYGYGYGGYYGHGPSYGWGGGTAHTTYNEYDYTLGTLVIDIYDTKEKRLVWESIARGETHENPKGQAERVNKLVARMMLEYPVKPIEGK